MKSEREYFIYKMKIEYDCAVQGRVSVWYGQLGSQDGLDDYTEVTYSQHGDAQSRFLDDFPMSDFDEDYTEKFYFENVDALRRSLKLFSYIETFMEQIEIDLKDIGIEEQDSLFFVYDCDASFMKDFSRTQIQLLGVYDYSK